MADHRRLVVLVDPDLHGRLFAAAGAEGRVVSAIVRRLVEEWLRDRADGADDEMARRADERLPGARR